MLGCNTLSAHLPAPCSFAVLVDYCSAMGVLTAGSPCAVVLVPLAYVCAIATITRKGVLVKSGAALDNLMAVDTVALDKTGGPLCTPHTYQEQ